MCDNIHLDLSEGKRRLLAAVQKQAAIIPVVQSAMDAAEERMMIIREKLQQEREWRELASSQQVREELDQLIADRERILQEAKGLYQEYVVMLVNLQQHVADAKKEMGL